MGWRSRQAIDMGRSPWRGQQQFSMMNDKFHRRWGRLRSELRPAEEAPALQSRCGRLWRRRLACVGCVDASEDHRLLRAGRPHHNWPRLLRECCSGKHPCLPSCVGAQAGRASCKNRDSSNWGDQGVSPAGAPALQSAERYCRAGAPAGHCASTATSKWSISGNFTRGSGSLRLQDCTRCCSVRV